MAAVPILVIAPDERWLRVLEVTLKLGGFQPIARRSVEEARHLRAADEPARAAVLDLGADSNPDDLDAIRRLLNDAALPMVVILPERLAEQHDRFERNGASVVVRPYPPSELHEAVRRAATEGGARGRPTAGEPDADPRGE